MDHDAADAEVFHLREPLEHDRGQKEDVRYAAVCQELGKYSRAAFLRHKLPPGRPFLEGFRLLLLALRKKVDRGAYAMKDFVVMDA